jgi:hypothetical protein
MYRLFQRLSTICLSDYADIEEDLAVRKLESNDEDLIKGNLFVILFTIVVKKFIHSFANFFSKSLSLIP